MARPERPAANAQEQGLPPQQDEARWLWEALCVRLSGVVARCNQHWFLVAEGWLYDGDVLTLRVPSQAHADWLSSELYRERLGRAAREIDRAGLRFAFVVVAPVAQVHDGAL